ncbi:MAG: hypothetical protein K2K31_00855, partial [Clostridia bacterium]|nr:hypothetical protein [Clostridia bacterium]
MKKVLKIASYDFKRIMLNPITIGFLVAVLVLCFITGLVYKIPASGEYSTQITADTTIDFYD